MIVLCLGAAMAGMIAAAALPFPPFALAVLAAAAIGSTCAVVEGGPVGGTCLSAAALLVASQLGYGIGLLAAALAGHGTAALRRGSAVKAARPPGAQLRTGNEPR